MPIPFKTSTKCACAACLCLSAVFCLIGQVARAQTEPKPAAASEPALTAAESVKGAGENLSTENTPAVPISIENAFSPLPSDPIEANLSKQPSAKNIRTASQPKWEDLSAKQQLVLAPLAEQWGRMPLVSKRKWVEISKTFHTLSASDQEKLQHRMSEWVGLNRTDRSQARLTYLQSKDMSSQEKAAYWQAYQQLSEDEKRRLANTSSVKPTGAASVKPQINKKLPEPLQTRRSVPPEAAQSAPLPLQNHTLLPKSATP